MNRIDSIRLKQVQAAFEVHLEEVDDAPMANTTKDTYTLYAGSFVRWLRGGFEPGRRNRNT